MLLEWCMSSSRVAWGLIPNVATGLGFLTTLIVVDLLERLGVLRPEHSIEYNNRTKRSELKQQSTSVPVSEQLKITVLNLFGPSAWLNAYLGSIILPVAIDNVENLPLHPSLGLFAAQFLALHLLGDLFLYIGHRVQHEILFLWKHFHTYHHRITACEVSSIAYMHTVDTLLQGAFAFVSAAILVQPHPLTLSWYVYCRISENTLNHCGYEHPLLNFLWLKWLPLRASVSHHDLHHHFGNYGKGAKNYGEMWIIWDWLFGTLRPVKQNSKSNLD